MPELSTVAGSQWVAWGLFFIPLLAAVAYLWWRSRRLNADLEESRNRYRTLFDHAPEAVVLLNAETRRFVDVNANAVKLFKYSYETLLSMGPADLSPEHQPDGRTSRESAREYIVRVEQGESPVFEWVHVDATGQEIQCEVRLVRMPASGRDLIRGSITDITERRRAEQEFRKTANMLKSLAEDQRFILENMQDFVYRHGTDGVFFYLSPTIERITGYTEEEWKAHYTKYMTDHPMNKAAVENTERALRQGYAAAPYTVQIRHKSGSEITLEVSERVYQHEKRVAGIIGVARDITDRLEFEQERRRLEEELRQSQKMQAIGQLAGGVAHDFNNLLTAILGNVELLLERQAGGALSADTIGVLEQIRSAGRRAASMTKQLLTFSRKQILVPEVLDPCATIDSMREMLVRLIGEHYDIQVDAAPGIHRIIADEGQFQQVIINLVLNAADAMPGGGTIHVALRNEITSHEELEGHTPRQGPGFVRLSVRDSGEGMSDETRARVFEPFFTTKPVGKGVGLGLSTVYGIVSQAGGCITVDSVPGRGSEFRISWPATERGAPERAPADATSVARGSETILLCEDEPLVRQINARVLRAHGYEVIEAGHGKEALDVAANYGGAIDVLVTDVIMPEMNGRALADAMFERYPGMHVLYVSGYTSDVMDQHGVDARGIHFLQKPFRPATLLSRVREIVDAGQAKA